MSAHTYIISRIKQGEPLRDSLTKVEFYTSKLEDMINHFQPPHEKTFNITAIDDYLRQLRSRVPKMRGLNIKDERELSNAIFDLYDELVPIVPAMRPEYLKKLIENYNSLDAKIRRGLEQLT